jgi:hypothetical protein
VILTLSQHALIGKEVVKSLLAHAAFPLCHAASVAFGRYAWKGFIMAAPLRWTRRNNAANHLSVRPSETFPLMLRLRLVVAVALREKAIDVVDQALNFGCVRMTDGKLVTEPPCNFQRNSLASLRSAA